MRPYSTITTVLTEMFLQELREKHNVENTVFSSMVPNISKLRCNELDSDFRYNVAEIGTASNVSFII